MRVIYVAGDGPLRGWSYAVESRLPLNEELELDIRDGIRAVYRVGQDCKLWFIQLVPETV